MANVDTPNGFRPYKMVSGQSYTGQMTKMYGGSNLFLGDAVIAETAGNAGYQSCTRATSGTGGVILGVVVGWEADPAALDRKYYVASDTYAVYVCTDPDVLYKIQGDGAGTIAINDADIGLNVDFVIAAGDTTTGASNMEVDESTTGATAVATPLHLVAIDDSPKNEVGVANQDLIVKLNMHAYGVLGGMTTGV